MLKRLQNKKGSVLIGGLLMMILLLGLAISLTSLITADSIANQRSYQSIMAMSQAEAAIEKTIWELNDGQSISCSPTCVFDNAEVLLSISDIDSENKEILAEAYVPSIANYKSKKTVKVAISATPASEGIAFNYAIQAGTGGIDVSGSSEVEGNLYSNGNISVTGSAKVEEPGDAWAVGSISEPNNGIEGTNHPGATPISLPTVNTSSWIDLAQSGGTITEDYSPPNSGSYTDLGPTEITGNMSMSNSGQKINLLGPLYIQGDLTISGGEWKLDDAFGAYGTVVLVDGKIRVSGSAKFFGNSSGAYILFISTNTANQSNNSAISYTGSATGEKLALYAMNGAMKLAGSGKIIAMTGQTLFISGSGKIEYEAGLASTEFSGGPGGVWNVSSWQKINN